MCVFITDFFYGDSKSEKHVGSLNSMRFRHFLEEYCVKIDIFPIQIWFQGIAENFQRNLYVIMKWRC